MKTKQSLVRRDLVHLISKRASVLSETEAVMAWRSLAAELQMLSDPHYLRLPRFNDLVRAIRRSTIGAKVTARNLPISSTSNEESKMDKPGQRKCRYCGDWITDWVDPDWARGPICRTCESTWGPDREVTSLP